MIDNPLSPLRDHLLGNGPRDPAPTYFKWIGGALLLAASAVLIGSSLQHIFTQGVCCADDSVFSLVAKRFATTLEYGFPTAEGHFKPFGVGITVGPTMILPGALAIAVFGPQSWVTPLTSFTMFVVQLAVFAWLLTRTYDKWRVAMLMAAALLALIATTRFFNYYAMFLGEAPALGFLLIGAACLQMRERSLLYLYVAGLMFGLAVLTKLIEVFAVTGLLAVWFAFRFASIRWSAILEGARIGVCLLAPLLAFEFVKFLSLGPDGYLDHWVDFRALSAELHHRPEDVFAAFTLALSDRYLLSWISAAFVALMFVLAVLQLILSKPRGQALLPLLLFGGVAAHFVYVINFSNLWPRYFWAGVALLDFAIVAPLLLLNSRAAVTALLLLAAMFAPPQSVASYIKYQNNLLARNTEAERRVVFNFIDENRHLPIITQWWGSGADILYLVDRPQKVAVRQF